MSTCEIEYIAVIYTAQQATWLRNILEEIEPSISTEPTTSTEPPPIPLAMDNQGAIVLAKLAAPNRRTRYINIRYHYIRDCIENGTILTHYTFTEEMLADNFTKTLNRLKFNAFTSSIGMYG